MWKKKGFAHEPNHTCTLVLHSEDNVMAWACVALSGLGSLIFSAETHDGSSRINSEVSRYILSVSVQRNASSLN